MKDPSGGTTGRVKPYGRLGWMGARAEYSLMGRGLPLPHALCRGRGAARSTYQVFFNLPGRIFRAGSYCAGERWLWSAPELPEAIAAAGGIRRLDAGTCAGSADFAIVPASEADATGTGAAARTAA